MKNENLLRALNLLDDKYIDEANPQKTKAQPKRKRYVKLIAIAACICLMVTAINLWLFIPFNTEMPDVSKYSNSEYFLVIEKLNALSYKVPKYKNNFDKLVSNLLSFKSYDVDMGVDDNLASAPENSDSSDSEEYQDITDNQVQGVTEGDIIKRSSSHIYYLSQGVLRVYTIDKENSNLVGEYNLSNEWEENEKTKPHLTLTYQSGQEMYLSSDAKTVTIVSNYFEKDFKMKTAIVSLDVSDPASIYEKNHALVDGSLISSRLTDGKLLIMSKLALDNIDFSKEETFIPQILSTNSDTSTGICAENIACPDKITSSTYTVFCLLDENSLEVLDTAGFLSYSEEVYVSKGSIYGVYSYWNNGQQTEITRVSYGDKMKIEGSVSINGYIKDRYSLDEYEGILRAATTTEINYTSASLYCIDINTMKVKASIMEFAPKGETVRSVRFDKSNAYVCTAIQLSDPVFFFDLSDINNITYKDTGTIEGFSTSLINLNDGYLLGIGVGSSWNSLKVEIYRESESSIVSVCSYELENTYYSNDYKSYYIDRTNNLFGFGISSYYDKDYSGYVLLVFTNNQLVELLNVELDGNNDYKRGVYIDGYFYILSYDKLVVEKILDN